MGCGSSKSAVVSARNGRGREPDSDELDYFEGRSELLSASTLLVVDSNSPQNNNTESTDDAETIVIGRLTLKSVDSSEELEDKEEEEEMQDAQEQGSQDREDSEVQGSKESETKDEQDTDLLASTADSLLAQENQTQMKQTSSPMPHRISICLDGKLLLDTAVPQLNSNSETSTQCHEDVEKSSESQKELITASTEASDFSIKLSDSEGTENTDDHEKTTTDLKTEESEFPEVPPCSPTDDPEQ